MSSTLFPLSRDASWGVSQISGQKTIIYFAGRLRTKSSSPKNITYITFIGEVEAFPVKEDQGMLFEGPLRTRDSDCLGFADYAEVLANRLKDPAAWPVGLGIFAQWGAGKVM